MSAAPLWLVHCRTPRGAAGPIARTTDPEELAAFLTDAAHVPGGHSPALYFPETEAEVAALLGDVDPVLVIGAQSSLTGGATPRGERLLATSRMTMIAQETTDAVVVGAGVVLAELTRELATRGRWYPAIPTYDGATVGGTVATNAAGAATFKYGATRAWVRGLTVVLPCGDVLDLVRGEATASPDAHFEIVAVDGRSRRVQVPAYRMPSVRKLAAGYFAAPGMDLVDLFIGAEGTLGVVTSVTLGVLAQMPAWFVGLVPCRSEPAALALADDLRRAAVLPVATGIDVAAIEYLDTRSLALARADGSVDRLGLAIGTDAAAALLFQIALPPDVDAATAAAHVARADDPTSDTMLGRVCRLLARHDVLTTTLPALPGETTRREALLALREAVPLAVNRRIGEAQRAIDPALTKSGGDVVVPLDRLGDLVQRTRAILAAEELDHAIWGHLSDGNLHPNVLPRHRDDRERATRAQIAIGRAAIALGGSPLSEHGVGRSAVKQQLLRDLYGDAGILAMQRVKRALDPRGRLAPGVIFPP